jgi:hypothetical protein
MKQIQKGSRAQRAGAWNECGVCQSVPRVVNSIAFKNIRKRYLTKNGTPVVQQKIGNEKNRLCFKRKHSRTGQVGTAPTHMLKLEFCFHKKNVATKKTQKKGQQGGGSRTCK